MYARVVRVTGSTQDLEPIATALQERAIPVLRQQHGFQGAYWMADRQSGRGLTVILWQSEQAANDAEQAIRPLREEVMHQRGVTMEGVDNFEVFAYA